MNERFEILESAPGVGLGLFAAQPIKKGAFIAEYTGAKISSAEADASKSRYIFEVDETWSVDAESDAGAARYVNHSCDPNTEAEIEDGHINIYATRAIPPGEEITIDYGEEYFDEFIRPVGCRCKRCRQKTASR